MRPMQRSGSYDKLQYNAGMDLRKLRHAVVLAEEGTFARASRRVNLTQPALTRSIQSLEASLRIVLFDRTTAGVRPTVDGLRLLDHARAVLRQADSLVSEAAQLGRGETGKVAFGIGPMLTPALGSALTAVLGNGATLDVRVEIEPVHLLEELLLDDRIDFFIADSQRAQNNPALEVVPIRNVPAGLFVRAGHPLAGQPSVSLIDLTAWPLASPALDQPFGKFAPAQAIACEDCHTLKQVVLSTDAILVAMSLSVAPELADGRLVQLAGARLPVERARVGLVRRIGRTPSASAKRIGAAFAAVLADQPLAA